MQIIVIFALFLASVFSQENPKVGITENVQEVDIKSANGEEKFENEVISVELKRKSSDIKLVAQLRVHLIQGVVHLNGHAIKHNIVNHVQMSVTIVESGVNSIQQKKPVELRVLVIEDGQKLIVEEQFITVEGESVEQIDVTQVIWESNIRKPHTTIKLSESKIHERPVEQDQSMFIPDDTVEPKLPEHGYGWEGEEDDDYCRRHHHHKHHHKHHHHHHNESFIHETYGKAKCLYKHLSWKVKIALFSVGFFGLLTAVVCCALCAKRRQRRRALEVSAPMDDTVSVDVEGEEKKANEKSPDGNYEFHFEFDNSVVVDDKKELVEQA